MTFRLDGRRSWAWFFVSDREKVHARRAGMRSGLRSKRSFVVDGATGGRDSSPCNDRIYRPLQGSWSLRPAVAAPWNVGPTGWGILVLLGGSETGLRSPSSAAERHVDSSRPFMQTALMTLPAGRNSGRRWPLVAAGMQRSPKTATPSSPRRRRRVTLGLDDPRGQLITFARSGGLLFGSTVSN